MKNNNIDCIKGGFYKSKKSGIIVICLKNTDPFTFEGVVIKENHKPTEDGYIDPHITGEHCKGFWKSKFYKIDVKVEDVSMLKSTICKDES